MKKIKEGIYKFDRESLSTLNFKNHVSKLKKLRKI